MLRFADFFAIRAKKSARKACVLQVIETPRRSDPGAVCQRCVRLHPTQGRRQMPNTKKPNILFIMADDIGWFNISCNNNGIMGYRTPNIDRIAKEGANFTDFYGQQSCTAGRAAFINRRGLKTSRTIALDISSASRK
jgi:Sulfatase